MNQFEALCKLASDESWCWNLYCTTCGHLHFKYAFLELSKGKSPEDSEWIIHSSETSYHRLLGTIPKSYTEFQKINILKICLDADILSIAECCKFPDWLGYLGLVLEQMPARSDIYKSVSAKWAGQLRELVLDNSQIHSRLSEIAMNNDLLNIKDLEECETDMKFRL